MENTTCPPFDSSYFRYPLFTLVYSVVLMLGLPLNGISLWIFFRRLGLHSVPAIYMANLAVSDLLFIISLPLRIYYFATTRWPFGDALCMIPGTLFSVNIYSSSLFIGLISLDRFLAVVYPLRSRALRTPGFARLACGVVWLLILALGIPIALNHGTNKDACNVTRCFESYSETNWKFGFVILCLITGFGIILPLVIIALSTVLVIKTLHTRRVGSAVFKKHKIIWMFIMNLLMYTVCFVPFHVAFILYALHKLKYLQYNFFDAQTITMCLASMNSCLDPIIYYFTADAFWKKKHEDTALTSMKTVLQNQ
ncbi:lysophosphatidic acid receptor 4-like [Huso huso]|uniref:Lysophosphatidic acid receptor 4-like n=1 Tax=Huso huso TaxID=61971 RepID=A0ABR0Z1K8_HUSHU